MNYTFVKYEHKFADFMIEIKKNTWQFRKFILLMDWHQNFTFIKYDQKFADFMMEIKNIPGSFENLYCQWIGIRITHLLGMTKNLLIL